MLTRRPRRPRRSHPPQSRGPPLPTDTGHRTLRTEPHPPGSGPLRAAGPPHRPPGRQRAAEGAAGPRGNQPRHPRGPEWVRAVQGPPASGVTRRRDPALRERTKAGSGGAVLRVGAPCFDEGAVVSRPVEEGEIHVSSGEAARVVVTLGDPGRQTSDRYAASALMPRTTVLMLDTRLVLVEKPDFARTGVLRGVESGVAGVGGALCGAERRVQAPERLLDGHVRRDRAPVTAFGDVADGAGGQHSTPCPRDPRAASETVNTRPMPGPFVEDEHAIADDRWDVSEQVTQI